MALIEFTIEDRTIIRIDSSIYDLLGYSDEDLIGKPEKILYRSFLETSEYEALHDNLKKGIYSELVYNVLKKDGNEIRVHGIFKPIFDKNNKPYKVVNLILEVTGDEKEILIKKDIEKEKISLELEKLRAQNRERLKELACINQTNSIIREGKPIDETLQKIVSIIPKAWQYPEYTVARIIFDGKEYLSSNFCETKYFQKQPFETIDNKKGYIEVYYTKEFPDEDEGPFLKEERNLIVNLADIIRGYLNMEKGKAFLKKRRSQVENVNKEIYNESLLMNRKLLQLFLNKQNADRDILHDLMPFKVKEILLISTLYDAHIFEKEGIIIEDALGEYLQLNLSSMPRITGVSTYEEAIEQMSYKHFDLVILMMGVDRRAPLMISKKLKEEFPYIPNFLLCNNNSDLSFLSEHKEETSSIDKVFVWNGDSRIFFAMVKYLEDKVNLENDTKIAMVRLILLVEDSEKYYSRYLPLLYRAVLEQTKRIIDDVSGDDFYKILRMRARPKIVLVSTYEEAIDIVEKYKNNLLCIITDMKFWKEGKLCNNAGEELIKYVRNYIKDIPAIIQSSDPENSEIAYKLKVAFIDKNSNTIAEEIKSFITHYLGFGTFFYKNKEGKVIGEAKTLKDFENQLRVIPDDSLVYHARRDHFSLWLMARGEIQIAKMIKPIKVSDFEKVDDLRNYLVNVIHKYRHEQNRGKVIPFDEDYIRDESVVLSLSQGSFGGKGRGVAFINKLIYSFDFEKLLPGINIKAPKTFIIGTDEFEYFIEKNNLKEIIFSDISYKELRKEFISKNLSEGLQKKIRKILRVIDKPLAIRSSGLFEDSLMQPFAGIFETYLLPNSHPDLEMRVQQVLDAIKMVYASVYSDTARAYIEAINYKIEEERMAVVIQEVVGNPYEEYYYPHISGVAQSYNYYPFGHMKPEEGFAVCAVGLGCYVVDGDKAYRFSPKYPNIEVNSVSDMLKNTQTYFIAIDTSNMDPDIIEGEDAGLVQLDLSVAEKHGTLKHLVSVYDADNDRIVPGLSGYGPRIVNFANILKYNYIPLAKTIETMLDIVKEALGSPVEIEFAVDLNKDKNNKASFYLLQIKPLIGNADDYSFDVNAIPKEDIILFAEKSMGNGIISDITDVIYVDTQVFDNSKTEEMAKEIDNLNQKMIKEGRQYILIGPGRWGTRDRWIGIPVAWPQISKAKVIVETSLQGFPLDASSGSHFFHNVTSMNVGYMSVREEFGVSFVNYNILDSQELVERTKFFKHVRFKNPVIVRMDGKKRLSVITIK